MVLRFIVFIAQVPKTIPPWKAAFIEPLACSIHGVERGDIQFNHVSGDVSVLFLTCCSLQVQYFFGAVMLMACYMSDTDVPESEMAQVTVRYAVCH